MSRRLVLSAVVAVTLLGQAVALLYEIVVAASFGTGRGADALALALGLALVIANEVGSWVPILFQPEYIEARTTAGDSRAAAFFVRTATLLTGIGAAIAILLIVTAPGLLSLVAGGAGPARDAVPLLRWLAPIVVLGPLSALLTALLQAHGRFTLPALRQVCWYVVAVGIVAALASRIGPLAVPLGLLAGLALFCVVLMAALPAGTMATLPAGTLAITAMRHDGRLTRLLIAAMPLVLASCANYVNLGVERAMAARLGPGALAALTYAFRLLNVPMTLVLANAAAILAPSLAVHAATRETVVFETLLRRALRLTLVFAVPVAALCAALAEPIIRLVLERGTFTADSTALTARALVWYAPSLVGMAGVQVLVRAYQALRAIRLMVAIGIGVVALNLVLMPLGTTLIGFRGLPLAISISTVTLFVTMLVAVGPRLPGLDPVGILTGGARVALAGVVALGVAQAAAAVAPGGAVGILIVAGTCGAVAYAVALMLVSRDDARLALDFVAPWLGRPRPASA